jgi:predicted O-methyltransferase YrrM
MTLPEHAARTGDMVPHLATLTTVAARHHHVVEFGVRTGASTWALLDGLPADGTLISVEILPDGTGEFGADFNELVPERVRDDPRWRFIAGDDMDPATQAQLGTATLVFIDTTHEYHHTLRELELAARIGAETILLHDFNLDDVADAVHGFCRRTEFSIALLEPSYWGLVGLER